MLKGIMDSVKAGKNHLLARIVSDLTDHRRVWNYIFMLLYVFVVIYLVISHPTDCGNTAIVTTGGVVTGIFTNVVWNKAYEKKNKEIPNEQSDDKPAVDQGEVGAGD